MPTSEPDALTPRVKPNVQPIVFYIPFVIPMTYANAHSKWDNFISARCLNHIEFSRKSHIRRGLPSEPFAKGA
jgi:hypothetical protein